MVGLKCTRINVVVGLMMDRDQDLVACPPSTLMVLGSSLA